MNEATRLSILLLCSALSLSCVSFAKPGEVIYLIPENFTGGVIILFNQPDGITPETEKDGTVVYRVPKDGLIKVKDAFNKTVYNLKYYFADNQGNKTPIEYLHQKNYVKNPGDTTSRNVDEVSEDESNNKVFASDHRTVNFFIGKERVYIQSFIVEKPAIALQTYLRTGDRMFEIQGEMLKKENIHPEQQP